MLVFINFMMIFVVMFDVIGVFLVVIVRFEFCMGIILVLGVGCILLFMF